jgi:peroxiredoxin
VLGLSPDQPKALAKWKEKEKLPYTLLSDPEHEIADAFGAWGEKINVWQDLHGHPARPRHHQGGRARSRTCA